LKKQKKVMNERRQFSAITALHQISRDLKNQYTTIEDVKLQNPVLSEIMYDNDQHGEIEEYMSYSEVSAVYTGKQRICLLSIGKVYQERFNHIPYHEDLVIIQTGMNEIRKYDIGEIFSTKIGDYFNESILVARHQGRLAISDNGIIGSKLLEAIISKYKLQNDEAESDDITPSYKDYDLTPIGHHLLYRQSEIQELTKSIFKILTPK